MHSDTDTIVAESAERCIVEKSQSTRSKCGAALNARTNSIKVDLAQALALRSSEGGKCSVDTGRLFYDVARSDWASDAGSDDPSVSTGILYVSVCNTSPPFPSPQRGAETLGTSSVSVLPWEAPDVPWPDLTLIRTILLQGKILVESIIMHELFQLAPVLDTILEAGKLWKQTVQSIARQTRFEYLVLSAAMAP